MTNNDAPASRTQSNAAGVALLAAAAVILLLSPQRFSPWLFLAFLVCWVGGALFLIGIAMWPSRRDRRSSPHRRAPRRGVERVDVSPPRLPLALLIFAALFSAAFAVLGVLVAAGVVRFNDASPGELAGMVVLYLAAAAVLPIFLGLHARLSIRADSTGLDARSYLRHVRATWDEVTAIGYRDIWPILGGGRIYRVQTSAGTFVFVSGLAGAEALAGAIDAATGLTWERE